MTWKLIPPGVWDAGDVGGDDQTSIAASARWTRPLSDCLHALVVRYYYVVDRGGVRVEQQTEYLVCGDPFEPGGTERASSSAYASVAWSGVFDGEAAWACARQAPEPTDAEWDAAMPGWEVS